MATRKREEFNSGKSKHRGPNRVAIVIAVFVAIAAVTTFMLLNQPVREQADGKRYEGGNYNIGEQKDFNGQNINMTTITSAVEGGEIYLPLDEVIANNLIYTNYQAQDGKEIPLMSYIAPSGRVVAAFAMCEPCRSLSFHIEGNTLVCDTCATKWQLEDLAGISGGCMTYPPEEMPYEIKDGKIVLDENLVKSWTPRV